MRPGAPGCAAGIPPGLEPNTFTPKTFTEKYHPKITLGKMIFPEKIFYLNSEKNIRDGFNYISENYNKNSAYTFEKDILPAAGEIIYGKKIKNGYEIKVNVEQEGIFVFNVFY